jgi:hypothetical protein
VQGDVLYYAQQMQMAQQEDPSLTSSSYHAPFLVNPNDDFSGGLPLLISKVFHPISNGQQAIANAIQQLYNALNPVNPAPADMLYGPNNYCQCLSASYRSQQAPISRLDAL